MTRTNDLPEKISLSDFDYIIGVDNSSVPPRTVKIPPQAFIDLISQQVLNVVLSLT